jgi:hypothetical protein
MCDTECECEEYDPDAVYVGYRDLTSTDLMIEPTAHFDVPMAESAARDMMQTENVFGRVYYVVREDDEGRLLQKAVKA